MKVASLILFIVFTSTSVFAGSLTESYDAGRTTVLASKEIKALLKTKSGYGMIIGIDNYLSPPTYDNLYFVIRFLPAKRQGSTICSVVAEVEGRSGYGSVTLYDLNCKN